MADEFGLEHPGLLAPGIVADPSAPFRKTDAHWLASLEREPRGRRAAGQVYRGSDARARTSRSRSSTLSPTASSAQLNYDLEAVNAAEFKQSLDFLGFVDVPTFLPELSTSRVLTTEWIPGQEKRAKF
ncbi:hypothetical protein SO694_0022109 [Aureococcus anophagefferens]|uniref:ABC1 atypical kinase-like domain-containing protein n=1 Tax=Aureococcus anophagefferens TaxID=44056 RepID=A0ABR1G5S9_AURAN